MALTPARASRFSSRLLRLSSWRDALNSHGVAATSRLSLFGHNNVERASPSRGLRGTKNSRRRRKQNQRVVNGRHQRHRMADVRDIQLKRA